LRAINYCYWSKKYYELRINVIVWFSKPYMELCILLVLSEHYHTKNLERTGSNASIIYNVVVC